MPHPSPVAESPESPRSALSESVRPINESFEVTLDEARELWLGGVAVTGRKPNRFARSRVRLSADGQWLLRRNWPSQSLVAFKDIPAVAQAEFERLQETGINAVSRAMVASPASASILTVSPWLPDLEETPDETFAVEIAPRVNTYLASIGPGGIHLGDVWRRAQYSYSSSLGLEALHDVDPYLKRAS